jgi:fucose permease
MEPDSSMQRTQTQSKTNHILLLLVVFGGFFIFGLSENIKGPALPRMQTDFTLSELQLGFLLSLNSLGYLLACSYTGWLSLRIGIRSTGIIAFVSMAVSGILMYASTSYGLLTASYFLLYLGNGMLEIGLGIMAARIFTRNTGMMMNLSHFFYGLSSTVAPLLASSMMGWSAFGHDLGWRGMYLILLMLSLLPVIPTLYGKFPESAQTAEERLPLKGFFRDRIAWMIVLILSCGVVAELSIGSWLVNYLEKAHQWSTEDASGMLSLFFLFFMLSRLLLGPLTDRIGYLLSIILLSALAGLCCIGGILLNGKAAVLFAAAGIGVAPIYPTVMALLAKRYPRGTESAITFTVTLMGIGSVLGNLLIGAIIDIASRFAAAQGWDNDIKFGMQAGFMVIAALSLLCSVFAAVLYVLLRRRHELL